MARQADPKKLQELLNTQIANHDQITEINLLFTTLSVNQSNAINRIHAVQKIKLTPLSLLYEIVEKGGSTTHTELAEHFPYTKQAMTLAIDSLEADELVYREVSEADRRVKNIIITDKGVSLVKEAYALRNDFYERFAQLLTWEEREQLLEYLRKINHFYKTVGL